MQDLNFRTMLYIFIDKLKWLLIIALAVAVLVGGYVILFVQPSYSSECSLYVMNLTIDENGHIGGDISSSGLSASQQMVNEYISIIKADIVIDAVVESLNEQGYVMTNREVLRSLTMTSKDRTALLLIKATTHDPFQSQAICNALMQIAPGKIRQVMQNLGTVSEVDYADEGTRVSSGAARYAAIGGLMSFFLSYVLFLVIFLLDNTFKGEQDLRDRFADVTVLGSVPELYPGRRSKGGKSNHA